MEVTAQLPGHVHVAIEDGLGTSFRTGARVHGNDPIVSWRYTEEPVSGPPPGPEAKPRVTAGALRIDLQTGKTDSLKPEEVPPAPEIRPPGNVERSVALGTSPATLWRVGDLVVAIVRATANGQARTVLRRWDGETGQPLPEVEVFAGDLAYRYVSADGTHLLASEPLDAARSAWVWHIFSLATGKRVAQIQHPVPAAWFFIAASSLVYEAPPAGTVVDGQSVVDRRFRLRAIDLDSGDVRWERPYRDTAYRGPYPPE